MWRNQCHEFFPRYHALHLVEEHPLARAPVRQIKVQVALFHAFIVYGSYRLEHPGLRFVAKLRLHAYYCSTSLVA
ncbi:hypothetical protein J2785_007285 [Burkholderia ambifaria]|nr:hypothetical protein [Burkholderia ambifaria]